MSNLGNQAMVIDLGIHFVICMLCVLRYVGFHQSRWEQAMIAQVQWI